MGSAELKLIEQSPDGTLMLGKQGERLVLARDFFAMFQGDQEWRLALGSKTLGTIPLSNPVAKGNLIVFAGRRWQIVDVDERAHVLAVAPHQRRADPEVRRGERRGDARRDSLTGNAARLRVGRRPRPTSTSRPRRCYRRRAPLIADPISPA